MRESGYYPPGAENDPRAPWNEVDDDGEGEEVFNRFLARIGKLSGQELYESNHIDVDGLLEFFEVPVFDAHDDKKPWDELTPMTHAIWNAFAEIIAYFGHDLVSQELVEGAWREGDL